MFGRWSKNAENDPEGHALARAVRTHLPDVDSETVRIITAIAGLLGGVAYADRQYSQDEAAAVRAQLETIAGLTSRGVESIVASLKEHLVEISTVQSPRYCRTLVELADRDLRLRVLGMLVDIAAADGNLSTEETTLLRNTATSLGLTQSDYNALQNAHRDKLNVLRKG